MSEVPTGPDREPATELAGAGVLTLVNCPTRATLLEAIEERLVRSEGFAVATLNLDHVVKLRRSAAFREAYRRQSYIVADGNPIVWLSRRAGRSVDLVPGSELIDPLAALAARLEVPMALLGSDAVTLETVARRLLTDHPGLRIAARIAPPLGYDPDGPEAEADLKAIRRSGAQICLLALGAPKQEILAARARHLVPGCGFVSIGAGLDFIAGRQARAPLWVRRIAMEWAWRMLGDPRRLARRYWECLVILPGLVQDARRLRDGRQR